MRSRSSTTSPEAERGRAKSPNQSRNPLRDCHDLISPFSHSAAYRRSRLPGPPSAPFFVNPQPSNAGSNRFEVLDQIGLFRAGQIEAEMTVVMLDHRIERGETDV